MPSLCIGLPPAGGAEQAGAKPQPILNPCAQVYHLQEGLSKQDFIKQSEKKNGKPSDILRKCGAPV